MASNSKRDFVLMLSIIVRMMSGMLIPLLVVVLRTSNDASLRKEPLMKVPVLVLIPQ